MATNIFQIWESLGRITPFAVRRDNWRSEFYTIVERIECEKMPYGKAFGFSVAQGQYSDHYDYDKKWRESGSIPSAGSYQWTLVTGADLTIKRPSAQQGRARIDERVKNASSILRFGKFNGSTVAQAFEAQPGYISWLVENISPFVLDLETITAFESSGFKFPDPVKELNARKLSTLDQ